MLPRLLQVSSLVALVALADGCSDPQCPHEFTKVGKVCRRIPVDAAWDPETYETDGEAAVASDAGVASSDAQPSGDAQQLSEGGPLVCPGECLPGEPTSCTTSCGSAGLGTCAQTCSAPAPAECAPPAETCNAIDDDCDGIVDPGLLVQKTAGTLVWTQPNAPSTGNASASAVLFSRDGGGANIMYRGQTTDPGPIRVAVLDASGKRTTALTSLAWSNQVTNFVASSTGKYIAIAARHAVPGGMLAELKIHILRSTDFSLVSEQKIDGTSGPCEGIFAPGISLQEDATGDLHVAVIHSHASSLNTSTSACDVSMVRGSAEVLITLLRVNGTWTPPAKALDLGAVGLFGGNPTWIAPVPCRSEWLLGSYVNGTTTFRRLSLRGAEAYSGVPSLQGLPIDLISVPSECGSEGGIIALAYAGTANLEPTAPIFSFLQTWRVNPRNGEFDQIHRAVPLGAEPSVAARISSHGGKVFAAGLTASGMRLSEIALRLDALPTNIAIDAIDGSFPPSLTLRDLSFYSNLGARLCGVAHGGIALVVSCASTTPLTALNTYRSPGDTDQAVTTTYAVGCPSP